VPDFGRGEVKMTIEPTAVPSHRCASSCVQKHPDASECVIVSNSENAKTKPTVRVAGLEKGGNTSDLSAREV
jgi:hypothetical protein